MSVYRKDSSGKLVKIAGSLTQRWNMLMLPTKHSKLSVIDEGQSYDYDCYEITEAAEPYITKLTEMTTYSLFLENANETTVVIVKYKNQSLFVYGVTSIGQLQDKIDLYTIDFSDFNIGNLVLNGIMYLSGDTSNFVQKNTIADLQGIQQDTTNDTAKLEFNSTALSDDYTGTFVLQNANKTEYNNQCRIAHFKHNTDISKQRLLAQLTTQTGTDTVTNLIGFGAQTDGKGLIGDVNRPVGWFAQVFGQNLNTVKTLELDTEGLWLDNQEISPNAVRYDKEQSLTDAQKTQARNNLGLNNTGVAWGDITGTLSHQTDLQNQLNGKLSTTGGNLTGAIAIKSTDGTLVSHLNDDGTNDYGVSYKNNTFEFGNLGKGIKLLGNTARPKYESTTTEDGGVELALLSDVEPVDETYLISEAQWQALNGNEPYTYVASVTATHTIGTNTEVGTLNNSPALFATYGFVVGTVNNQTVQIFSIDKPTTNVSLTVRYRG